MPSTSRAVRPASSMALRTASTAMARVVRPEWREYSVSPKPTMQYTSRRVVISAPRRSDRRPQSAQGSTSRPRKGAGRRAQEQERDGGHVEGGGRKERRGVSAPSVVDPPRDDRPPAAHGSRQGEQNADQRGHLLAAEQVAHDPAEQGGDGAVRIPEQHRGRGQREEAGGHDEAHEGERLQPHGDGHRGPAPDVV